MSLPTNQSSADPSSESSGSQGLGDKGKFKTHADIVKILKDIGLNEPERLTEKDLKELLKYTEYELTQKEIDRFLLVRQTNRNHEMIPVPSLKEKKILTLQEMLDIEPFHPDKRLDVTKGNIKEESRAPIDFSKMSAADWMKVIVNCGVTYGRIFSKLGTSNDRAEVPLFFPPNRSLFGTRHFKVSRVALSYFQKSQLVSNYSDKTVMANITAGGSFQSPWVSGSAEYSHNTQERKVSKGSEVKSVFKVEAPIGIFTLPRPSEIENSKLELSPGFGEFLKKYLLENPKCNKETLRKVISRRYGDIVPKSVKIGVACYTTQTQKMSKDESLETVSDEFQASVSASRILDFQGEYEKSKKKEFGNQSQKSTYSFTAIAGSLPNPGDPLSVADFRLLPSSWRVIHYGSEFIPVYEYIEAALQEKINSFPEIRSRIYPGETMKFGHQILSPSESFRFVFRNDGSLAVYHGPYSVTVWESNVLVGEEWKSKICKTDAKWPLQASLKFQIDGDLVLSDSKGNVLWHTETKNKCVEYFQMKDSGEDSGDFVGISNGSVVWRTNTAELFINGDGDKIYRATLKCGDKSVSCDGNYRLKMQVDSNLMVYDSNNKITFTTTERCTTKGMEFDPEGNLSINGVDGNVLWSSDNRNTANGKCILL